MFSKYSSIENSYQIKMIRSIVEQGYSELTWVALEKIHGANFSFIGDGTNAIPKVASRNGLVDASFYSCGRVATLGMMMQLGILYRNLIDHGIISEGDTVQLYGELFGGNFYGESVPEAKQVQKGVNYHPDVKFMAFDIKVTPKLPVMISLSASQEIAESISFYLSWADFIKVLPDGIDHVPLIGMGSLEEVSAINNALDSKVPAYYDLEAKEDNTAEGLILRPLEQELKLHNGKRVIMKSKNAKFSERTKVVKDVKEFLLPEYLEEKYLELSGYFTSNRLSNVISKLQEAPTQKDFGKLSGLLMQDALKDFDDNYEGIVRVDFKDFCGDDWKKVSRKLSNISSNTVRESWMNILDGEF